MRELSVLESYKDEDENVILTSERFDENIEVAFHGRNNRIELAPGVRLRELRVRFDGDNGTLVLGGTAGIRGGGIWNIRIGQDATVRIGANCTTTSSCLISAVEGVTVRLGDDVMISSDVQLRGDDGHPIFDVTTGERLNPSRPISIGSHVWLGLGSLVLGGSRVGNGSVVGARSVVTRHIPNNCIAVGSPAKVIRRDVAWDRIHLSQDQPPYKPDASMIEKNERFWQPTVRKTAPVAAPPPPRAGWASRLKARVQGR
ncbi:MAG: hypothetical protein JWP74_638 [Marmoricola sp.]|nr:hypothetical protein [Marmoricola sp.]